MQNVVVYAGTAADRAVIQEHEWYYAQQQPGGKAGGRSSRGEVKFNVLLCSYDMLLKARRWASTPGGRVAGSHCKSLSGIVLGLQPWHMASAHAACMCPARDEDVSGRPGVCA